MKTLLARFVSDETGTEMIEYAVVASIIVVVGAVVFQTIGGLVTDALGGVSEALTAAANSGS